MVSQGVPFFNNSAVNVFISGKVVTSYEKCCFYFIFIKDIQYLEGSFAGAVIKGEVDYGAGFRQVSGLFSVIAA